jgi:uncharacterized protein YraI
MPAMRLLLAALVFAALPLPALADATALTTLNVRSGPGTGYAVVDVLRRGEVVDVAGCRPGWCFVHTRHSAGWASAGYLAGLVDHPRAARVIVAPRHVVVDRVVVIERHRYRRVARWPEPWSEPIYPPRRVLGPTPYPVQYPEKFW